MKAIITEPIGRSDQDLNRLLRLMETLDQEFVPPVSSRTDLYGYCKKLIAYAEVFIAVDECDDIGLAVIYANDEIEKRAFLTAIGVKAKYRGKNVGEMLLNAAVSVAKSRGMTQMGAEASRHNPAVLRFNFKQGFKVCEAPLNISTQSPDSIYFVKQLS